MLWHLPIYLSGVGTDDCGRGKFSRSLRVCLQKLCSFHIKQGTTHRDASFSTVVPHVP